MIKISIRTPEKTLIEKEVEKISLPGKLGYLTILKDHAPCIIELGSGDINISSSKEDNTFTIDGGFVKVMQNNVCITVPYYNSE